MTQKELRDAGELYDANYDPELTRLLDACKDKCHEYNAIRPSDWAAKETMLREIVGFVGAGVRVQAPFWCDYGANIAFGDNFYANHNLVILAAAKVTFGRNVFVGPDCGFHTAEHPLDAERRNAGLEYAKPITVGDDVWFGAGVHVMPGVTIGNNVVIGAGAVVTQDIPSNSLALGVPARVVKAIETERSAMKREDAIRRNREAMRLFETCINTNDLELGKRLISAKAAFKTPVSPEPLFGAEGYLSVVSLMRASFPDVQWKLEDMVADETTVAVQWTCSGTFTGEQPFAGIAPNGRRFSTTVMNFYKFDGAGLIIDDIAGVGIAGILSGISTSTTETRKETK